jgi:signal transduction histidine kinase
LTQPKICQINKQDLTGEALNILLLILRTIRIDKDLDDALNKDANEHGVSENALISSILVRYIDWDGYSQKFGRVSLPNEALKAIIEATEPGKLKAAAEEFAASVPKDSIFELLWNERTLNEELKMADKMQQEFINIAAHELRTPAQSILGYTELAKRNPQYMEKYARSFLEVMYRNAFRIHKLTKDILDVTRIEGQTLNLDKIRFNLKDLIKSLVDDIQPKLVADSNNNKVKVVYRLFEDREGDVENHIDTVFVQADRDRIAQGISNLLDNALKFTHQGLSIKENKQGQKRENQNELLNYIIY